MNSKRPPAHKPSRLPRLWTFLGTLAYAVLVPIGAETIDEDCGCDATPPEEGFFGSALEEKLEDQSADADTGQTRLDLFVMSLCPYGMQAQAQLLPLAQRFGDAVDLRLHFIADERDPTSAKTVTPTASTDTPQKQPADRAGCAAAAVDGDGPFASLHGQPEIDEGRRQLVIAATWPDAFSGYVLCRSAQGPGANADAWVQCARRQGLDPQTVRQTATGPRGEALFRSNIRLANRLDIDLSPTLLINGEEFDGLYEYNSVARRLCADADADACADVPACGRDLDCERGDGLVALCRAPDAPEAACDYREPVAFSLTVLERDDCDGCNADDFLQTTRQLFPGAAVERLGFPAPRAAALAARHDIQSYPAFLFDSAFAATARFGRVRHLLHPLDDGGFSLDPRLNRISYWPDRPLHRDRLDVFAPAVPELEARLLDLWPIAVPLRLHYIGTGVPQDERRRRACLAEDFPAAVLAYARARQAGADWADAAATAGIGAPALQRCAADRGDELLRRADITAQALSLEADGVAVLQANRRLLRRATPGDLQALWPPKPNPLADETDTDADAQRGTP